MTAADIRRRILDVVSRNGGHLASSLGAVELSMALAEEFDPVEESSSLSHSIVFLYFFALVQFS